MSVGLGCSTYERRERARHYVRVYLRHHPCVFCGEERRELLTFHHRDPGSKKGAISRLAGQGRVGAVISEIPKCIVLCRACHQNLHLPVRAGGGGM